MKIHFFFRKASPDYHSIEELFSIMLSYLPDNILFNKIYVKFSSNSILNLICNCLFAYRNQSHINHITGDIHYIGLFLKPQNTILTIHDIGSIFQGSWIRRKIIRNVWFLWPMKRLKYITVISEFTKQEIINYFKIKSDKIWVIPNCISTRFTYTTKPIHKDKPCLLQIGTKPNKNIPNLIQAITGLQCKLRIVGKLNNDQINLLRNNKIEYENYFNISDEELVELYKQTDILTFISTYEGFGMPIIEANAMGIPVITSTISVMPETAGNAACLVNPYLPDEIRNGIIKIIQDSEYRENLIHNGLKNVEKYHPMQISSKYIELYNQILKEKNDTKSPDFY
jgi:glycosyltransferase involved in cell wall biosynthesis